MAVHIKLYKNNIKSVLPAGRRIQGRHILYDFSEGVKAVWQKGAKP